MPHISQLDDYEEMQTPLPASVTSDKDVLEKKLRTPFCPFYSGCEFFDRTHLVRFTPVFHVNSCETRDGTHSCYADTQTHIAVSIAKGGFNPISYLGQTMIATMYRTYNEMRVGSNANGANKPFEQAMEESRMIYLSTDSAVFTGIPLLQGEGDGEFESLSQMTGIDGPIEDYSRDPDPFCLHPETEEPRPVIDPEQEKKQKKQNIDRSNALYQESIRRMREQAEKKARKQAGITGHSNPQSVPKSEPTPRSPSPSSSSSPSPPTKETTVSISSSSSSSAPKQSVSPSYSTHSSSSSSSRKTGGFASFSDFKESTKRYTEHTHSPSHESPVNNKFGTPDGLGMGFADKEIESINADILKYLKHVFAERKEELAPQYWKEMGEFLDDSFPKTPEGVQSIVKFLTFLRRKFRVDDPYLTFFKFTWERMMMSSLPSSQSCEKETTTVSCDDSDDDEEETMRKEFLHELTKRFKDCPEEEKLTFSKEIIHELRPNFMEMFPRWVPYLDEFCRASSLESIPRDKQSNVYRVLYFVSSIYRASLTPFVTEFLESIYKSHSSGHCLSDGKSESKSSDCVIVPAAVDISGTPSTGIRLTVREKTGNGQLRPLPPRTLNVRDSLTFEDLARYALNETKYKGSEGVKVSISYKTTKEVTITDITQTIKESGMGRANVFITVIV